MIENIQISARPGSEAGPAGRRQSPARVAFHYGRFAPLTSSLASLGGECEFFKQEQNLVARATWGLRGGE